MYTGGGDGPPIQTTPPINWAGVTPVKPNSLAMNSLHKLVQAKLDSAVNGLTFKLADLEIGDPSKSGNIGFRVTCDNGKQISFWSSTMEDVVEETEVGVFRVKPKVRIAETADEFGYHGLIPADAEQGGYWKK